MFDRALIFIVHTDRKEMFLLHRTQTTRVGRARVKRIFRMRPVRMEMHIVCRVNAQTS